MLLRPFVIVESPFRGATSLESTRNHTYLARCLRHAWESGEIPFASHALFPLFLDDSHPEERLAGITAGYEFWLLAKSIIFYLDYGMSEGMLRARDRATKFSRFFSIEERHIGPNPESEPSL